MGAVAWIAVAGMCLNLAITVGGYLVAWGSLKGSVNTLKDDVEALQREMAGFGELRIQVARISERQEMWIEQLKELNSALRWMREPAPPYRPGPMPKGTTER